MNTSKNNSFDAIEKIIEEEGLRIETVDIHPELDVMLIVLNTKVVLRQMLSSFPRLKNADKNKLLQYELIASGTGVHWKMLDEDLSLKGFLQEELRKTIKGNELAA
ncbi:MAG: DUF2442 domain-containing protein [Sphingobacteriales bacterium]|nr:DUF2442 domain-containing protein [Sphingobacteriales bacterium]MBI3718426.1 DUF2442 domain-containing protein [Sphingobacteriales bacterium]